MRTLLRVGGRFRRGVDSDIRIRSAEYAELMASGYIYLGNGPAATNGGQEWSMRPDLYARCIGCGGFVSLDPTEYGGCDCGALYKDIDAGRFGSNHGDHAIEIYRRSPQHEL